MSNFQLKILSLVKSYYHLVPSHIENDLTCVPCDFCFACIDAIGYFICKQPHGLEATESWNLDHSVILLYDIT